LQITVHVALDASDTFAITPDAAAEAMLGALNADPTVDYCLVTVQQNVAGVAGTPPEDVRVKPA